MAFISIIIPVYNSETYLAHCLDSIHAQSFTDWEVVLVDDGSSDSSPELCDRYAEKDSRFTVIHQANTGTSGARNAGIAAAKGGYVTFVDNDDWWIDSNCLENIYQKLTLHPVDILCHNSLLASSGGKDIDYGEETHYAEIIDSLSTPDAIKFLVDKDVLTRAVWTKVVRRELLDIHSIEFPTGMRNEDTDWSAKVLAYCTSIGWIDQKFYAYRVGHSYAQTAHKLAVSSVNDLQKIIEENLLIAEQLDAEKGEALKAFLAYPLFVWAGQASALSLFKDGDRSRKTLRAKMPHIFAHCNTPVVRIAGMMARIFGTAFTAKMLGIAFKKKYPQHS